MRVVPDGGVAGTPGRPPARTGDTDPVLPGRGWPDLRLAAVAVAAWLAALGALHVSWRAGVGVAVVAATLAAGGAWWVRQRASSAGWIAVAVLVGVVAGAGGAASRVALRDAEPLAGLVRGHATVQVALVVADDPRPVRGAAGRPAVYAVPADLSAVSEPVTLRLSARVLVLATDPAWRNLLPGQRLTAAGRLEPARPGDLRAAVLSATGPPERLGEPSWAQRAAGGLRAGLQRACAPLPREPGGLLPGLVVGDTSSLEPAVADDFRATGMTHLLAVSGSNVALVVGFVLGLVRWCRAGPRVAAALSVAALVGFVILVRPSPSVLRAAAMGGVGLLGLILGRPATAVPALGAVVALLVLVDPQLAAEPGFALSVLATAGILLVAPGWRDALRDRGVPAGLAEALAVPAAAQFMCAPVIAALWGTVGLVSVPANLLAVPAVAPATILGVATALLSAVWPTGAEYVAWIASWPARWLVLVARIGAETPAGVVPWPGGTTGGLLLAAFLLAVVLLGRYLLVRRLVAIGVVAVVLGALPVRLVAGGWPPQGWLMVVCDVGQGDTVVLPAGPGQAVVVDAGPDPAATDRCLRRLGVRHVPLLVLSHFHADHVGGVDGVFRDRTVGAVLTSAHGEPAAGRGAVLRAAAARAVPVSVPAAGARYFLGGLELTVLGPAHALGGTRSDANNNSLVLRAVVLGRVVLLAGDAEEDEQRSLLARAGADGVRADVLKVAHHGSAYQDPEFLDAVDPAIALVSVGTDNSYGHPNAAVLSRLARGGARVERTDERGDVAATVTDQGLAVVARGRDPP